MVIVERVLTCYDFAIRILMEIKNVETHIFTASDPLHSHYKGINGEVAIRMKNITFRFETNGNKKKVKRK